MNKGILAAIGGTVLGAILLYILVIKGPKQAPAYTDSSEPPSSEARSLSPVEEKMKQATLSAWQHMQQIDEASNQHALSGGVINAAHLFDIVAKYSQISHTGVDPEMVSLLSSAIAAYRQCAQALEKFENEAMQLQSQFGHDQQLLQQAMQQLQTRWQPDIQQANQALNQVNAMDKEVALSLSRKYGIAFSDQH